MSLPDHIGDIYTEIKEMGSTEDAQDYNRKLLRYLRWPIVAYGILAGLYVAVRIIFIFVS